MRKYSLNFAHNGAAVSLSSGGKMTVSFPGAVRGSKTVYDNIPVASALLLCSMICTADTARAAVMDWEQLPVDAAPGIPASADSSEDDESEDDESEDDESEDDESEDDESEDDESEDDESEDDTAVAPPRRRR